MLKVYAFQIADSIDIKQFRATFTAELYHEDSDELFYQVETQKFIYVFKYGLVCFLGYNEVEMTAFLQIIQPYCKNMLKDRLSDEFDIEIHSHRYKLGYNKIELEKADTDSFRLIM